MLKSVTIKCSNLGKLIKIPWSSVKVKVVVEHESGGYHLLVTGSFRCKCDEIHTIILKDSYE